MTFITRACLAASVVLCFAIEPASAQYNVFNSRNGPVTDVIINGVPATPNEVVKFEQRCNVDIEAGRWWGGQQRQSWPRGRACAIQRQFLSISRAKPGCADAG